MTKYIILGCLNSVIVSYALKKIATSLINPPFFSDVKDNIFQSTFNPDN